jgi:hypothetical protein
MRAAVLADFFNEIGASQKSPRALSMSEFGRLADMMRTAIHFAFWPKGDVTRCRLPATT